MKKRLGVLIAALAVGLLGHETACSLVVNPAATQCSNDDDCRARGPDFVDTFCSAQGVCTRAVDYCATNAACIDRLGNEATICRKTDHKCVELLSKNCKLLADKDDLRNDEAVIIGVHGIPSWSQQTASCESSIELVRRDFKSTQGGLPPTPISAGKSRPIVFLSCDVPIGQQKEHELVSDHLFDKIRPPVVIGPYADAAFVTYGLRKAIASETLMITVADDTPAYDIPGRQGLFFSSGFPRSTPPIGVIKSVELLEPIVRQKNSLTRDLKVAYVYLNVGAEENDAQVIYENLKFNGKTAKDNGPTLYKEFQHSNPATDPNWQENFANTSLAVKDFAPDIIAFRSNGVDIAKLIENVMPGTAYYVFDIAETLTVTAWVFDNEPLRKRVLGWRPGRYEKDPRVERFNQRFRASTPPLEGTPSPLGRNCADAAYAALYAMASLANEPINGKNVGRVMLDKFKETGTKVQASPSSILPGMAAAQAQQDIFLQGNELDFVFNRADGFAFDWKIQFWCLDPDVTAAQRVTDSGVTFSGITKEITGGPLNCNW